MPNADTSFMVRIGRMVVIQRDRNYTLKTRHLSCNTGKWVAFEVSITVNLSFRALGGSLM